MNASLTPSSRSDAARFLVSKTMFNLCGSTTEKFSSLVAYSSPQELQLELEYWLISWLRVSAIS